MKKCAKCDFEYEDDYDGCPACARRAERDLPPGSPGGAVLSLLGFLVLVWFFMAIVGDTSFSGLLALVVVTVIVNLDARGIIKPEHNKPTGMVGTSAAAWTVGTLLVAGIVLPMYFYQRPRIISAYTD